MEPAGDEAWGLSTGVYSQQPFHRETSTAMSTEPTSVAKDAKRAMPQPTVAVCAITYRRPEWLARMLQGLARQKFDQTRLSVKVIVVENEAAGPGAKVCRDAAPRFPFPLSCYAEPTRGIPFARNTAIARAGQVDFIAFIDDDETPEPDWLEELLRVQAAWDADLVAGPVLPVYEQPPPEWLKRGGFHTRQRFATGSPVAAAGSGNLLIRRAALAMLGQPFDPRLALTGGSDTHFFLRMAKAGGKAVWADEAVIWECMPPSRCTRKWVMQRAFRTGATYSAVIRDIEPWPGSWAKIIWRGSIHLAWGLVSLPIGIVRGRAGVMLSLKYFVRGVGIFNGLLGFRFDEYRTVHGK